MSRLSGFPAIAVILAFPLQGNLGVKQADHPALAGLAADPAKSASGQDNRANTPDEHDVDWAALLPEGEGRLQASVYCASCHSLKNIVADRRADESGWKDTVERMVYSNGATVTDEDISIISHYLAQHFGPETPKLQLPVSVNAAPKEVLRMLPGITEEDAAKLLAARAQEKINLARLESILSKQKADRIKPLIVLD